VAEKKVRVHQRVGDSEVEVLVAGSDVEHLVRLSAQQDRCTCPWFSKHQGERGPCKHVLAARLLIDGDDSDT
jgi:predicted nucleic acid-binding Zn finger protein